MSHQSRPPPPPPPRPTHFKDEAVKKSSKSKSKSKVKSVKQWFAVYNLRREDLEEFLIHQFPGYETKDFKIRIDEDEDSGEQYLFEVPHKLTDGQRSYIKEYLVIPEEERAVG